MHAPPHLQEAFSSPFCHIKVGDNTQGYYLPNTPAGAEELQQSLAAAQTDVSRMKADLARATAASAKNKEEAGAGAASAAAAAASESAARARAAVAVGARQDAEKTVSALKKSLEERETVATLAREVSEGTVCGIAFCRLVLFCLGLAWVAVGWVAMDWLGSGDRLQNRLSRVS